MQQHNTGNSGTALEAPLSVAARGVEMQMQSYVVFGEDLLRTVAEALSTWQKIELHQTLRDVVNLAESLACALFRVHVDDAHSIGGTNCSAGGQVFGPTSLRVNLIVASIRSAYKNNPGQFEEVMQQPAVDHAGTDPGLRVSNSIRMLSLRLRDLHELL